MSQGPAVQLTAQAIVCAVRQHGEHGTIVRSLTAEQGLVAGYVRGGRSRRLRPILLPGNVVMAEWRARTDDQLAAMTVELVESRAPLFAEPLTAAAIEWVTALVAVSLPEGQTYPSIHAASAGLLDAIAAASRAHHWAAALVRFELLLLNALGFGLDLSGCVAGGTGRLGYVSPRSAAAVSVTAGDPHAARLLPLPGFLIGDADASWSAVLDGLRLTGFFLERDILTGSAAEALTARERLMVRLKRIA